MRSIGANVKCIQIPAHTRRAKPVKTHIRCLARKRRKLTQEERKITQRYKSVFGDKILRPGVGVSQLNLSDYDDANRAVLDHVNSLENSNMVKSDFLRYVGTSSSFSINKDLRNGIERPEADALNDRILNMPDSLKYNGNVRRVMKLNTQTNEDHADFLTSILSGGFQEKGLLSTTVPDFDHDFGKFIAGPNRKKIIMNLKTKTKGLPVDSLSNASFLKEREILFPRNLKFKTLSSKIDGYTITIDLEEVGQ